MILKRKPQEVVEVINLEEFVARIKEAVQGENAAQEIQEAVKLYLANYKTTE